VPRKVPRTAVHIEVSIVLVFVCCMVVLLSSLGVACASVRMSAALRRTREWRIQRRAPCVAAASTDGALA
jgi:hypothetical protein